MESGAAHGRASSEAGMFTAAAFAEKMARLDTEQRLRFYEVFAHDLTVAIRGIWSDESITPDEKVERIKWVNEILHSATAKVWIVRLKTHEWTEKDTGSDIAHYCGLNSGIESEVVAAFNRSYSSATQAS
jgi:hypothetical protein